MVPADDDEPVVTDKTPREVERDDRVWRRLDVRRVRARGDGEVGGTQRARVRGLRRDDRAVFEFAAFAEASLSADHNIFAKGAGTG